MTKKSLYSATVVLFALMSSHAHAGSFDFNFSGSGTGGNILLTYGTATDSKSGGLEVTGISGTFTDTNLGIINANIVGLESINHASPDSTNLLAPNDFSKFNVAAGTMDGSLSYDNLFYPNGSPSTASDYLFHGGFLDIYGLLFQIAGGDVVNIWSNGITPGATSVDYGVAVATSATTLDYVSGVSITPEPSSLWLFATGMLAMLFWRRHSLLRAQS